MSHAQATIGSSASSRRARSRAVPAEDRLRPARGLMLGLGLSSLIWTALIAFVAL